MVPWQEAGQAGRRHTTGPPDFLGARPAPAAALPPRPRSAGGSHSRTALARAAGVRSAVSCAWRPLNGR